MSTVKIKKYRTSVYAMWTQNRAKIKFSTGINIEEKYWNKELSRVRRNHPQHKHLNQLIKEKIQWLYEIVIAVTKAGIDPTTENVRLHLSQIQEKEKQAMSSYFHDQYDDYIKCKSNLLSNRSIRNIKHTQVVLKEFEQHQKLSLNPKSFDKYVFEKYLSYLLTVREYKDATIDKHLRVLKTYLLWKYPDMDFSFIKYTSKINHEHNIITITWDEFVKLKELKLSGYLDKTRDLFIFLCCTGMRYSDSQRFVQEWIKDDTLEFRQQKTGGIAMTPLLPESKSIIAKYCNQTPRISAQKFNVYLKKLFTHAKLDRTVIYHEFKAGRVTQKLQPLNDLITSHIARKSFITLMLEKGIPIQDVMKMSGHSDYRAMRPYIAISKKHLKEVSKLWKL